MKEKIILLFIIYLSGGFSVQGRICQWIDHRSVFADSTGVDPINYSTAQEVLIEPDEGFVVWQQDQRICIQLRVEETVMASVTNVLGINVFTRQLLPYGEACTPSLAKGVYIVAVRTSGGAFYSKQIVNRGEDQE